jgi:hypothetical protein
LVFAKKNWFRAVAHSAERILILNNKFETELKKNVVNETTTQMGKMVKIARGAKSHATVPFTRVPYPKYFGTDPDP